MNYILCWKSCKSSSWIIWISPTTVHGLCQSCVRPTVTNFANCSGDVSTVQERAIQFSTANFHRRTPSRSDRLLLIPFVQKCAVGTSSVTASVSTPQRHRGDSVLLLPWYLPVYVAGVVLDLRGVEYVSTWVVAVAAQLCGASCSTWIDLAVPSYYYGFEWTRFRTELSAVYFVGVMNCTLLYIRVVVFSNFCC